jgi:hypothetical protein
MEAAAIHAEAPIVLRFDQAPWVYLYGERVLKQTLRVAMAWLGVLVAGCSPILGQSWRKVGNRLRTRV